MDRELAKLPPVSTAWEPKGNHIKTRWADDVDPDNVLPEYPRPLMQRDEWVNLNGLWDYAIAPATSGVNDAIFTGSQILVPFAIESSLSGVCMPLESGNAIWYKKEIEIPAEWSGRNVILHIGAADYEATVYANGTSARQQLVNHKGGHTSFDADLTNRIQNGKVTVYIKVVDPTDEGAQPVGKQRRYPSGNGDIYYTSTSGIWQSVWMEPVEKSYIADIRTTPNLDDSNFKFDVSLKGTISGTVKVSLYEGNNEIASVTEPAASITTLTIPVSNPKLWSPESPNLYGVKVTYDNGTTIDDVDSYAAMRKIGYRKVTEGPEAGHWRLTLNNQDYFQFGPLDQGYWPDGIMTAPTDEALAYDLEKTKEWGFNMVRKHMKVEPARWYYHCDRLGLLVWQDMPSQFNTDEGDWTVHTWYRDHVCGIPGSNAANIEKNFKAEWKEILDQHYSNPCIVVWTPFNERWGQFKTSEIVAYTQDIDNTRLVNPASGGNHYKFAEGSNTFVDEHTYAQPLEVFIGIADANRPFVLGEYGGLGFNTSGHRWYESNSQTYNTYTSKSAMTDDYVKLVNQIEKQAMGIDNNGNKTPFCWGAAVYTQTTDVETEVNGLMTYDREVMKFDEKRVRDAAIKLRKLYGNDPTDRDHLDLSSVEVPFVDGAGAVIYYDLMGNRHSAPVPGFNIMIQPDGTAKKIFVK
ncbi:MAG: beta-galactosidase [Muribaculaceae bacterium]|nr:beta-galactosidase [Muribaculaceae bacterium]